MYRLLNEPSKMLASSFNKKWSLHGQAHPRQWETPSAPPPTVLDEEKRATPQSANHRAGVCAL
jgi:hypothetical protein